MNFGELVVWLYKKLVISIVLILIATSVIRSATKPIEVGNSEFPLQQKWSAKMKDRVVAVSASENGTIFARSPYSLNALDASTGKLLWKFLLEGQADSRPALSLNEIVYVSDSKYIYMPLMRTTESQSGNMSRYGVAKGLPLTYLTV